MPSNVPFVPQFIREFLAKINNPHRTPHEVALDARTAQLPGTMTIPHLVENQSVKEMEVPAEEANFLKLQIRMLGRQHDRPMKAIDIGTFTGRSAMAMAEAMKETPNGGKVITCDTNVEYTNIAKEHWEKAGLADRIDLKLAPATETLQKLIDNKEAGTFDLVFIDADKPGYDTYYEKALELLRPGGLVILDNMLWSGRVADNSVRDINTDALRSLNEKISADPRVAPILLGFEDGVMVAEKLDPERFRKMSAGARQGQEGFHIT